MKTIQNTKEKILLSALKLFAKQGYEAVSTADIAAELGITKGALYRHFENKQAIFDGIIAKMEARDAELSEQSGVPCESAEASPESYKDVSPEAVRDFSKEMFDYWTADSFASDFRKMLVLEQHRSERAKDLLDQYLTRGPVSYLTDIFESWECFCSREAAEVKAFSLMGAMYIAFSVFDSASDTEKDKIRSIVFASIDDILGTKNI